MTRMLAHLVYATDLDYVESFQSLARVHLEIRQQGASAQRLLRKGILELDVGDYEGARRSLERSLQRDPNSPEAHFQRGVCYALLACVKAEALPFGPGHSEVPRQSIQDLLETSADGFEAAAQFNTADHESQASHDQIRAILDQDLDELGLAELLRADS